LSWRRLGGRLHRRRLLRLLPLLWLLRLDGARGSGDVADGDRQSGKRRGNQPVSDVHPWSHLISRM
jgi:hypothetical protein